MNEPKIYISESMAEALREHSWTKVTEVNPPLHGSTICYRNEGRVSTMLSLHSNYLLFHYIGGNITINTPEKVGKLTNALSDLNF